MELFSIETLLLYITLTLFIFYHYLKPQAAKKPTTGFKSYPLVGSLPSFVLNRHRFLDWSTAALRDCPTNTLVFFRPGKVRGVITANPDNVEHMLKTNFTNFPKGKRFNSLLQDFLGTGIFNSDGALWKLQRKTASHEFNTKSLRNFIIQNVTVEIQTRLIPLLQKAWETESVIDLQDVLERFAFDNVCKLAFNVDPACLSGEGGSGGASDVAGDGFMRAFEDAATLSSARFMSVFQLSWRLKRFLNIGNEKRLRQSISTVHAFADEIIRSRMEAKGHVDDDVDLLSRFIATDNDSPEFLRDTVISFILAGRDTTSSALSWFFWILSSKPEIKRKIVTEIQNVREKRVCGESGFGYEELKEMSYLHAAISEAMRLYPPVPIDTKACLNDDVFPDGTVIKKNWFISYHTYAMGRMENVWGKDCSEYKPERWLDEDGLYRTESPFRYPVFHAGPRMCLGKDMAYIQMKSIAASVMEKFEIDAVDKDTCPEHVLSLTLRMKRGLPVRVRVRKRKLVDSVETSL